MNGKGRPGGGVPERLLRSPPESADILRCLRCRVGLEALGEKRRRCGGILARAERAAGCADE